MQPAPATVADAAIERTAATVRAALPRLGDAEDGAMDATGAMVFIRDGSAQGTAPGFNCSGFSKWVVDGFYRPLVGTLTDITRLKERDLGLRGNRWTGTARGVARSVLRARLVAAPRPRARPGPGQASDRVESSDVRDAAGFAYVDDVGYAIADLPTVLFRLARAVPGRAYLGSVNRPSPDDPQPAPA